MRLSACTALAAAFFASAVVGCSASRGGQTPDDPFDPDTGAGDDSTALSDGPTDGAGDGGWDLGPPPCTAGGLKCKRVVCEAGVKTTLSGKVFDPSGKLPLYNVVAYVPNAELDPIPKGVSCDKCGALVSGSPITTALTDAKGQFTLQDVPVGDDIPLVIQVGKWRRKFVIPKVEACTTNSAGNLKMPRNKSEGDMPRVAIATGGADALECLFYRMGIDPKEFTGGGGTSPSFEIMNGMGGKTAPGSPTADSVWSNLTKLKTYDITILSCEGSEYPSNKSTSLNVMHDYASAGGRIFASHYHYYWFTAGPADFQSTASWTPGGMGGMAGDYTVDQTFPKGKAFADWLVNVGASTTKGTIALKDLRGDVSAVNTKTSQRWIYQDTPKYFTFNTPVGKPAEAQCGRVVFTDLHVSSGNTPGGTWPGGCLPPTTELSAQEKALVFLFFDLASCVQSDGTDPTPPPPK